MFGQINDNGLSLISNEYIFYGNQKGKMIMSSKGK